MLFLSLMLLKWNPIYSSDLVIGMEERDGGASTRGLAVEGRWGLKGRVNAGLDLVAQALNTKDLSVEGSISNTE